MNLLIFIPNAVSNVRIHSMIQLRNINRVFSKNLCNIHNLLILYFRFYILNVQGRKWKRNPYWNLIMKDVKTTTVKQSTRVWYLPKTNFNVRVTLIWFKCKMIKQRLKIILTIIEEMAILLNIHIRLSIISPL